jgi:hypothetical protein
MPVYTGYVDGNTGEEIDAYHEMKYDDRAPHERLDRWIADWVKEALHVIDTDPKQAKSILNQLVYGKEE